MPQFDCIRIASNVDSSVALGSLKDGKCVEGRGVFDIAGLRVKAG